PHGVNIDVFSPPANRTATWNDRGLPGKYGIGVFGRVRPQKGTEEVVDAMIQVLPHRPDWTAVIIGETTPEFRTFQQRLRTKIGDVCDKWGSEYERKWFASIASARKQMEFMPCTADSSVNVVSIFDGWL